jgi:hypothetical protein
MAINDEFKTSENKNSLSIIPQIKKTNPPKTASNKPILMEYFKRPSILFHPRVKKLNNKILTKINLIN